MSFVLTATLRTTIGKRVKDVRSAGQIPAIVYGHGAEPRAVSLGASEFHKVFRAAGSSSIIDVAVEGSAPIKALIQEVQLNPLTMRPQHVDLRQIRMDEELTVEVPLVFVNDAPAVKEHAGTLVHAYDALTITCLPADLPHEIQADLSTLQTFDDVITVGDLTLPKGVTVLEDKDVTIASVTPPLSEEQLKKMEEEAKVDVTAVKTEAEEKKAAEEEEKAQEAAVEEAAK